MGADLLVDDDNVGASLGEIFDKSFRIGDHQVGFEGEPGAAAYRLDDHWPHGDVGHEMPVHDIDLDALRACCIRLAHLFTQAGEIGR